MSETNYTFYFKRAYSSLSETYSFPSDTTMRNFIESAKLKARIDFQFRADVDIEVVETGQSSLHQPNTTRIPPEEAPAVIPSELTLKDKYENRVPDIAFYVRQVNRDIQPTA